MSLYHIIDAHGSCRGFAGAE